MKERIHDDQKVFTSGKNLDNADIAVILVHGRGATAQGMLQLAEELPEAAYLAPQATKRTWYPQSFMESREKNQPHLDSALRKLGSVVDEAASGVGMENTFIMGFSQGACLASEFAASNPQRFGGLILLSGGLIGEEIEDFSGDMEKSETFIGCAENDPHIPLDRVNATERVFGDLDADVEKYVFEGSHHGITDHELERASEIISGN